MVYKEYLRYMDFFGTKCCFYSDQRLKLYTPLGGIISLISICAMIIIFVLISLSSFKREHPNSITSSILEEEQKIKFDEEKIYIPWKIQYNKNNFNHSNILFPTIKYYSKDNKNDLLQTKILTYKFCNQTSMANIANEILIDSPLDQLYCIDMDDLLIGGSWSSDFLYYIEFIINLCPYNSECSEDETYLNNSDNYFEIIFYYPSVRFHEDKFRNPFEIKYNKNNVILNKEVWKINQLYLRKVILQDNVGIFYHEERLYQSWECSSINKDFYLMNQKNSKVFSLEIYVEQSIVNYYRTYNNIIFILAECLPVIFLVYHILKLIAKIFKLASINRKMTELLFENLTEKPNKFQSYIKDIKSKKTLTSKILLSKNKMADNKNNNNNNRITEENNIISMTNKDNWRNINNYSNVTLINKIYLGKNNNNLESVLNQNDKALKKGSNKYDNDERLIDVKINSINLNNLMKNSEKSLKQQPFKTKKKFISNMLFPHRYYLCTIFTKNIDLTKHPFCMSKKYIKVYYFLCQLFDISSYCILQKEFNIVKNFLFDEKNIQLIEQKSKINVNDQFFMRDMNDCIIKNKFHILGINNIKRKNETNNNDTISKK